MRVQWYGQSAFRLSGPAGSVMVDPFGDLSAVAAGSIRFEYPPIESVQADLVLITHEHIDHNAADVVSGSPAILRSTAGRLQSPLGEVLAVASEHDRLAGTERGPNTIFVFELDGVRMAHFGDLGQSALREEQAAVIGVVDLMFLPVGGGPTIGAEQAAAIVDRLHPRWVVPMHYRTPRIDFLETADEFLARMPQVQQLPSTAFGLEDLAAGSGPLAVVPAAP
jgi:L-ascorbate metabolism protein UlaG (beta-lactamase superfamily)